jgi:hypothetical protein
MMQSIINFYAWLLIWGMGVGFGYLMSDVIDEWLHPHDDNEESS